MSPATIHRLADRIRQLPTTEAKLAAVAHDVDGLEALAHANAAATRAVGDAVAALDDRCARIEEGVLEAIAIGHRAEGRAREAMASDLDLTQTVERERAARQAEGERTREMLAPIVADTARRAGNAGATKTAGAISVAALVAGLAAQPVETLRLLREIGPTGLAISLMLLFAAIAFSRFRRS